MTNYLKIRSKIWIDKNDKPFVGLGRILLLEQIDKHGSITRGAKAIKMSYRKAWQLVEDMNKLSDKPLVEKHLGGAKGGGASVTEEGKRVIEEFYLLQNDIEQFLDERVKQIKV